jgi:hypothetical protein
MRLAWAGLLWVGLISAQERVPLEGSVQDAQTGAPVPGARIVVPALQVGTVSSARGTFRLLLPSGTHELRVRSLGYEEAVLQARVPGEPLQVRLRPLPIELPGVRVQVELSAEEIIRNAMARRLENWRRLRTLQGLLYSKLLLGVGAAGQLRSRMELGMGRARMGMPPGEDTVFAILETFSRFSTMQSVAGTPRSSNGGRRGMCRRSSTVWSLPSWAASTRRSCSCSACESLRRSVRQRWSGTASACWSAEPGANTRTLPLPRRLAYVLELEPRSRLFPGFAGTVVIADSSFALMEARLHLAEGTAVPFLQQMELLQRYERLPGELWYPLETTITGRYNAVLLRGIAEVGGEFLLTRILTEVCANEPCPIRSSRRRSASEWRHWRIRCRRSSGGSMRWWSFRRMRSRSTVGWTRSRECAGAAGCQGAPLPLRWCRW